MSLHPETPLPSRASEVPEGYVQIDVFAEPGLAQQFAGKIEELSGDLVHVVQTVGISTFRPQEGSVPRVGSHNEIAVIDEVLLSFPWPAHGIDTLTVMLAVDHTNDTFVMEVSDPRSDVEPTAVRLRVATREDDAPAMMDAMYEIGVGTIENYDRCFFIYRLDALYVSLETIVSVDSIDAVSEMLASHEAPFVFDSLVQAIELKGKSGKLASQKEADALFAAYRQNGVIFERHEE